MRRVSTPRARRFGGGGVSVFVVLWSGVMAAGRPLEPLGLGSSPGSPAADRRDRGPTTAAVVSPARSMFAALAGPIVVILAAGQGSRMRSRLPKLLHPLCGRPIIGWPVATARAAGASKIVVVDGPGEPLREHLDQDVVAVVQGQARGTADAVLTARAHFSADAPVI